MSTVKRLRRSRPTVRDANMTTKLPTRRCREYGLLAVLLSSALRDCYAATSIRQAPAAFLHPLEISMHHHSVLPVRFYRASRSLASSSHPRLGVHNASKGGRVEDEHPSQPVKRGRGRPRIARLSPGEERRDDGCSLGHQKSRQTQSTAKGRGRGRINPSDSPKGGVVGGTRGSLQQPDSGVSNGEPQRSSERKHNFAKAEDPGNLTEVSSELEELGRYADALAKAGELEDSIAIKRHLEQLRVFPRAVGGSVPEENLNELVRQQLDREQKDEEEAAAAELLRRLQDVETKAIEDEMHQRHTRRQRKQRDQILASQQRQRLERDAEEQALEAKGKDSNNTNGWDVVGGEESGGTTGIGAERRREEGELKGVKHQEEALPSALALLETVEALLGEDDADAGRLPHPEEMDGVPDDEEIILLREMSEQNLLHNRDLRHVMVVIGKHLIRDQVTVEYASRIRRLVQGMKSGRLRPDLVCFTGGRVRDNRVADASAGYVFFTHLCEQHGVDLYNTESLVESESTCTKEAMMNVVREVSRLEREEMQDMEKEQEKDDQERVRAWPGRKYHFTLISNEYHLSRVIMVHEISESVSLLSPLKQLDASWGYEHVPYPYACYDDENKKFQADVYKTLEELVPLQVNVQAVARREEFFQEENYASLTHVRARVGDFIRQVHSSSIPLARHMNLIDLQRAAEQGRRGKMGTFPAGSVTTLRLDEALEWAAGALAKIQEIIEPAATRRNSVSLRAWAMCAALLEKAILQGQMAADPDRPLYPHEWGLLENQKPQEDPLDDDEKASRRAKDTLYAVLEEEGALLGGGGRRNSPGKKKKNVFYWEGVDAAAQLEKDDDDLPTDSGLEWMEELGLGARDGLNGWGDEEAERDAEGFGDGSDSTSSVRLESSAGPTADNVLGEMLRQRQRQRQRQQVKSSRGAANKSESEGTAEASVSGALPRGRRRNKASSTAPESPPPNASPSAVPIVRRSRAASSSGTTSASGEIANDPRSRSRVNGARVKATKAREITEAGETGAGVDIEAAVLTKRGRGRSRQVVRERVEAEDD